MNAEKYILCVLRRGLMALPFLGVWAHAQSLSSTEAYAVTNCSMHNLIIHAQQFGNTSERKQFRKNAQDEIFARGTNSLHFLLDHFHLDNMTIQMLTDEMVRLKLSGEDAASVLIQYLDSEQEATRKSAAYFLGYCDTPYYAEKLMPLLADDKSA